MSKDSLKIRRIKERFFSESSRVITKFYLPGGKERINHIICRVLDLSEAEVKQSLDQIIADFSRRHKDIYQVFDRNFNEINEYIPDGAEMSKERRCLIGAFFTHEYSVQAAAFFNPSIVIHPDQSNLKEGCVRVILSFRSTGEGHISSIEFRSGILDKKNNIQFDEVSRFVETPEVKKNPSYDKYVFQLKLEDMDSMNEVSEKILNTLPDKFAFYELQAAIQEKFDANRGSQFPLLHDTVEKMMWLARSNYELRFNKERKISEKVIFPVSENESRGIEDARFVRFNNGNNQPIYYATYTAWNGFNILPMLLETGDFDNFKIRTLNGKAVQNKGMALFPRKIDGKYMMISRQDGENLFIMSSDNIHFWHEAELLQKPKYTWEFIQIGNCGSPIETEAGWILLTHGVGPMRKYCIGAYLLDLEDPTRVIGRLSEPLLSPTEEEREGYVPNVLYTCGAMIHNDELIIPYSMSDTSSGIAVVSVQDLLDTLTS
ncbi:MAG: glycoside hydrolase family 130 protein [Deltaproteobacteria bacterium]|nr:glycoside hydrolase family 130 protein [Deltaproteobacteria bacterium]